MTEKMKLLRVSVDAALEEAYKMGFNESLANKPAYRLGLSDGLATSLTAGTFEWAMQQMRQGKTVRRKSCVFQLRMHSSKLLATPGSCSIYFENVEGTDWEIVPEPKPEPEGHDFAWAAEQVMCGRWARRKTWEAGWYLGGEKTTVSVHDTRKTDWVLAPQGGSK